MLQFETLLLKQLQKQQNRDEFCDTVLHTQGVSVPVHSCVLSAFSPRLYGTLSSMPVPTTGQRRLIELQAVDACTLLSLVSLLYSGQVHENKEQVLSAAQKLGIELPQWQEEEKHGGKVKRRNKKEDSDQEIEKDVDAREWDHRMTRRMEEGSDGAKEKKRESSTQTECGRETDERGAQTDLACSETQSSQTVYLIDQSTCSTNQEPGSYVDIHDAALALQAIHPERNLTTCNVLTVAPETGNCYTNDPPRKRRPRGRPRIRPLPPASRSFSTMTYPVDPTELDLLRTVTPTPTVQMEPIQPIDTLLDDIITGLHFLPPAENQTNHRGSTSAATSNEPPISKAMYPSSHSIKPTNPKQHMEGELGDILDHFLRTFDQQVGFCGLDVGDETSQGKSGAGTNKSDPSKDPLSNTPKTYTQLQSHHPPFHHQEPQEKPLHTSSTLNLQPQFTAKVNPSEAEKTNAQNYLRHRPKVEKPSTDQNIVQQFENRRLTRSQSKRKLETAFINLQNPVKRKFKEKQSADNKKKRQGDDQECSEARVNKCGVNILDKNNKNRATQAHSEGRQKQSSTRKRRLGGNRSGRKKRSVETRSHRLADFYERKKSPHERRPGNNECGKTKKNFGEGYVEAECMSIGFQAGQSAVKSQIGGNHIEIASSALEKVRMLLQLQDEEEDKRTNKCMGIDRANKLANERLVNHRSISGGEKIFSVENSSQCHRGEIQEPEDVGRVIVNKEFERQEIVNSIVEVSPRQEEKMANGMRQEEMMTEDGRAPFQLNLPSNAVSVFAAMPKMADLTLDVGDVPRLNSAARLSHMQPCQELLSPHTSTEDLLQLAESSVDDDVDVLEVSSPTSELPAVSTVILGMDLSTEEEEAEDDSEIDVLGLQPD